MKLLPQVAQLLNRHISLKCSCVSFVAVLLIYLVIHIWTAPGEVTHNKWESRFRSPGHFFGSSSKRVLTVPDGEGVWVPGRHIQIMSAIYDLHHNKSGEFRVMLPSFLQHSSNRQFYCCFSTNSNPDSFVEVAASLEYIDLRFMVDIQDAAFECILKGEQVGHYDHVSFSPDSCQGDSLTRPLKVIYPERRTFEFAVCTKVAYNRLEPQRLIEWFAYMQEMGASRVLTFHTSLHPDSRAVFDYYVEQGLLQLIHYKPRQVNGTPALIYTEETAQTRQARHEKTLTVRDCQYRLAGYDFIFTIDFDEMPVPLRPYGSLSRIYETLSKLYPLGAAFRLDPILLPPEWKEGRQSYGLYHWQFHDGTYIDRYCTKWLYVPSKTKYVATHDVEPKNGYKAYPVPQSMVHFLHFRTCKQNWHDVSCENHTDLIKDEYSLNRFIGAVLRRIRRLPLERFELDSRFVNIVSKNS